MSYVPGCGADVFISYAHEDNQDGWVTALKKRLTEKLNPFLAGRAEVWFDDRIKPGVYFKQEIQQKLRDTAIFVAVVSPSYLESEFSIIHELDWFQNQGGKEIIQLLKVPLEKGQEIPLPETHYKVLHDENDGRLLAGKPLDKILDELVGAMKDRLREFWELRPKIYVAQLRNENLKPRWDALKDLLHAEGYAVLPKGVLPPRVPDGRIREWLEAARLSVHLDAVPDDPLAQRQLAIARQIGRPVLALAEPPPQDQLPTAIAEVQKQLESNRNPAVYFIYDYYSDHQRVGDLPKRIHLKTGYDVFLPEAGEKYHKFRLQVSDGVLLFRGGAPEDWLKSQEQVLLQAAARPGRRTVEAKYFTHSPNGQGEPVRVTRGSRQEWIIERTGEPDIEDLQPFFDTLHSRIIAAGGNV
jgi:TIR domain